MAPLSGANVAGPIEDRKSIPLTRERGHGAERQDVSNESMIRMSLSELLQLYLARRCVKSNYWMSLSRGHLPWWYEHIQICCTSIIGKTLSASEEPAMHYNYTQQSIQIFSCFMAIPEANSWEIF